MSYDCPYPATVSLHCPVHIRVLVLTCPELPPLPCLYSPRPPICLFWPRSAVVGSSLGFALVCHALFYFLSIPFLALSGQSRVAGSRCDSALAKIVTSRSCLICHLNYNSSILSLTSFSIHHSFFSAKKLENVFHFFSAVTKKSCDWSSEDLISSVQLGTPRHAPVDSGVAAGENVRPKIAIFKEKFLKTPKFSIFSYFQNKVAEIRGKIGVCGYVSLTHLNPSLLSKFGGDAPASRCRSGTHNHFQKLTPLIGTIFSECA